MRDSFLIQRGDSTIEGFQEERALKLNFGNGIGIEWIESGWVMGGMKKILGRKNNVYSLEMRNPGVHRELKVIQSVWSIQSVGWASSQRCGLRCSLGTGKGESYRTCQGA